MLRSKRVAGVSPYVFSAINRRKQELADAGMDVIDLGIGAPDVPTPPHIVRKVTEELQDPRNFQYSPYQGCAEFREAVAAYYRREYQVDLNPETEILTLIGSKEGIGHFFPAVLNPGDTVLVPDPGYPPYETAAQLAGVETIRIPLQKEKQFVLDVADITESDAKTAKALIVNYPANPTGATVGIDFFEKAAAFAEKYDLLLIHDAAYQQVVFDGYRAPSVLEANTDRARLLEFGSLSKSYSMAGWRIAWAAGSAEALASLAIVKSNLDTSQFLPIQKAAALALTGDQSCVKTYNQLLEKRMIVMQEALTRVGIRVNKTRGSLFLWSNVPPGWDSGSFTEALLEQKGVIVTPGKAFGKTGEAFFRVSLTVEEKRLQEAATRIGAFLQEHRE
ncbi:aminotransferase class I/II-fold pyridoxal phosphate-dependent enzyme [Bacillus piscicola]|uniref:aminotransferase class I/II-fold pyridoxal phosphate-dependent enzyme n=1 Tax=Bacillus piscicola TaxID=1632684 RepID=UPI001F096AE9|nr:aminotransferase class I/II-fold pyridoxal phosphate-dependent enzyme [Bacillus piscicola]